MPVKNVKINAHTSIDTAITDIASIKTNIYGKIDQTKLEEVNHSDSDGNKYLYRLLDTHNLYETILCVDKLLNDIKSAQVDIDNTALEVIINTISKTIKAFIRELNVIDANKKKAWFDRVEILASKLEKMTDRLISLLSASIYTVRYGKQTAAWVPAFSQVTRYYPD